MPNWHWFFNLRMLELAIMAILLVASNAYTFLWQRRWNADPNRTRLSAWFRVKGYMINNLSTLVWAKAASFSFMSIWSWTHSLTNTLLIWDLPMVVITVAVYLIPEGRVMFKGRAGWLSVLSSFIIGFPVIFGYLFLKYSLIISWVLMKDPVADYFVDWWWGIKYDAHRLGAMCWNFGNGISVGATNLRYAMVAGLFSWLTGDYVRRGYRHRDYRY